MPAPKSFEQMFADLRTEIVKLRQRSPFYLTGMHPNGNGGIDSDNYVAGVSGYSFKQDGDAEFNDLTLRGGIIGNDALTEPVVPGVINVRDTGFAIPFAYTEVASVDVTVPSGCTRVLANLTGWVQGYNVKTTGGNNGAGGDYIYARVKASTVLSASNMPTGVSGSNGSASATMGLGVLVTGLTPGSSVHFAVMGASDYVIAAHANNDALLTGTLLWLR